MQHDRHGETLKLNDRKINPALEDIVRWQAVNLDKPHPSKNRGLNRRLAPDGVEYF